MTSYRNGVATGFAATRLGGSAMFGTRAAAAAYADRSVSTVRRYCVPIACDVGTRADLYDLETAVVVLRTIPTREKRLA